MTTATKQSALRLPTPAENPGGDVVIYDGHCKFCTWQIENLAQMDGNRHRLAFLSLHDPEVAKRYPDLTYDQLMDAMHVIDLQGRRLVGAAAVRYLTTRVPRLYWLWPLVHLPFTMPFWRWAYRQVAKRRYAILGKTEAACDGGTCHLHRA
jgi:predicted DCC family thiol-disulfide oxidoreductase YuxK